MHEQLVVRARAGDQEAFNELAAASIGRLYAVARLIVRDDGMAQDATQEALVTAWRRIAGLRDPARFDAWLHRLLVNACYREARRGRRRASIEVNVPVLEMPLADPSSDIADRDALERAFRRLRTDQRAALVLHHHLGLTLDEVAQVLGVPPGTVRSQMHRAARTLRAALEADARPGVVKEGRPA